MNEIEIRNKLSYMRMCNKHNAIARVSKRELLEIIDYMNSKLELLEWLNKDKIDSAVRVEQIDDDGTSISYVTQDKVHWEYLYDIKKEDVQVVKSDSEIIVLKIKEEYKILVKATGKLSDLNEESDK